jgi:hypothetical protein
MGAPILGAAGRGIGVLGQSLTRSREPTRENSFALLPTFHGRFWQQLASPLRLVASQGIVGNHTAGFQVIWGQ